MEDDETLLVTVCVAQGEKQQAMRQPGRGKGQQALNGPECISRVAQRDRTSLGEARTTSLSQLPLLREGWSWRLGPPAYRLVPVSFCATWDGKTGHSANYASIHAIVHEQTLP